MGKGMTSGPSVSLCLRERILRRLMSCQGRKRSVSRDVRRPDQAQGFSSSPFSIKNQVWVRQHHAKRFESAIFVIGGGGHSRDVANGLVRVRHSGVRTIVSPIDGDLSSWELSGRLSTHLQNGRRASGFRQPPFENLRKCQSE